jgi:hypothetical protein
LKPPAAEPDSYRQSLTDESTEVVKTVPRKMPTQFLLMVRAKDISRWHGPLAHGAQADLTAARLEATTAQNALRYVFLGAKRTAAAPPPALWL